MTEGDIVFRAGVDIKLKAGHVSLRSPKQPPQTGGTRAYLFSGEDDCSTFKHSAKLGALWTMGDKIVLSCPVFFFPRLSLRSAHPFSRAKDGRETRDKREHLRGALFSVQTVSLLWA